MLEASLLRPGDVILSRSTNKGSTWIAKFTKGRFSHASIYYKDYQLFEAVTDGVGFGALEPVRVELQDDGRYRVLCSSRSFNDIALYRCPPELRSHPGNDDFKLLLALQASFFSVNGSEYRRGTGLSKVVRLPRWIPASVRQGLLKIAGDIALGDRRKILTEEYFCSELVVSILQGLGLPILKDPSACPDEISPNDLANATLSNLVEVSGFPCSANPTAKLAENYVLITQKMAAMAISQKGVVKPTKELMKIAKDIQARSAKRMEDRRNRQ
jgi:hypothetical protein